MITWKILNIERLPSHEGHSNVVSNVYWCCYDSNDSGHYGRCFGNEYLDISSLDSFVSWDTLTENTVIQWVKDSINTVPETMDKIEEAIQYGMDNALHSELNIGVPW